MTSKCWRGGRIRLSTAASGVALVTKCHEYIGESGLDRVVGVERPLNSDTIRPS